MVFISQDRLKAISEDEVKFFAILPERKNGKFRLFAKTPTVDTNYYDYLILFEHENIEVVKNVMKFLANGIFLIPHDSEKQNVLVVDLPDLYRHGMKTKDFLPKQEACH